MAQDTFCGFPRRFTSRPEDADEPDNVFFLLHRLLRGTDYFLDLNNCDEFTFRPPHVDSVTIDDQKINLPVPTDSLNGAVSGPANELVPYLQELLNINGHSNMIVTLDHQKSYDFEILTLTQFMAGLKYDIREYRAQMNFGGGIPVCHPEIPHTCMWVAFSTGKLFIDGSVKDFPKDSVCYKSCYD